VIGEVGIRYSTPVHQFSPFEGPLTREGKPELPFKSLDLIAENQGHIHGLVVFEIFVRIKVFRSHTGMRGAPFALYVSNP
jgi:hypothetical protein